MFNPYFLSALVYAAVALLVAVDASLNAFGLMPFFSGLRWLRVHFITLGVMAEALFGFLASWAASRAPRRRMRWDIWLIFNVGLVVLIFAIPLVNPPLILAGGTIVFVAAGLLIKQLLDARTNATPSPALKFYVSGLFFLLIGILLGTGMWLGWGGPLMIASPLEAHIHANNWGFMGLMFAGLVVEYYPEFAGRPRAWPRLVTPIFWALTAGASLLIIGPWVGDNAFVMPGIAMYLAATLALLASMIRPILAVRTAWTAGLWHLLTAYVWIILPVIAAPMLILGLLKVPLQDVELSAPQALIYGWVLQVGYAMAPFLVRRVLTPGHAARLGGSWLSLAAVSAGGACLWASIFLAEAAPALRGLAYALWAASMAPFAAELWALVRGPAENAARAN